MTYCAHSEEPPCFECDAPSPAEHGVHCCACIADNQKLRAEVERLEALFQRTQGVHHGWVAEGYRLRAEVETLKRERDQAERLAVSRLDFANESFRKSAEYAVKLDMLTHEHKLAIAEADRYRAALEQIVDRATIETAPAANIARKALEGYAK